MAKTEVVKQGTVVGDKMDKTVVVAVESRRPHPLYKKIVKRRTKLKAHDEKNECRQGDIVRIAQSRPLSRTKRWMVVEITGRFGIQEEIRDEAKERAEAEAVRREAERVAGEIEQKENLEEAEDGGVGDEEQEAPEEEREETLSEEVDEVKEDDSASD